MDLKYIGQDQIDDYKDNNFPELINLNILSEDINLLALFLQAGGSNEHPTVILLHGIPGYDDPIDIGHSLRRCGINIVRIHYRGSWGVKGDYSIKHCIDDVKATIDYITDSKNLSRLRIDINNIFLVGISLGGFLALTHSNDKRIKGVFSISPYDIGHIGCACRLNEKMQKEYTELFEILSQPLSGVDGNKLLKEVMDNGQEWNLINKSKELSEKKIIITTGTRDTVAYKEFHQDSLVNEINKYNKNNILKIETDTDHCYGNRRIWLSEKIMNFINDLIDL